MNRFSRESSVAGGRNAGAVGSASLLQQRRRARAASGGVVSRDAGDEGLDLFSRTRRSLPAVASPAEVTSDGQPKLKSISTMSEKVPNSGIDDLLSGADIGKHDYDWLLTPPGTPVISSLDAKEHQPSSLAPKTNSSAGSVSTTAKASRFSVSQTENNHSTRPVRSSSLTRPSISSTYSGNFSNFNKTTSLNTSTASITSHRSSTPTRRPSTASSTTRQTTVPSSRPSTPTKTHPTTGSSAKKDPRCNVEKSRPVHGLRPSTPTSRPHVSASSSNSSSSSVADRMSTRPSTPSRPLTPRRASAPSPTPVSSRPSTPTRRTTLSAPPTRSSSVGRVSTANSRNSASSRPSSPSPRIRSSAQPIAPPDFPYDVPPNLRTKLPERSASSGRNRPGVAPTVRANMNTEAPTSANSSRRSSPIVTRGRLSENSPKIQLHSNGHETTPELQKSRAPNGVLKKPGKPTFTTESKGFGRTISKKSLDMALRHMDIRQGVGGIRGASLFPQSICSASSKGRTARVSDPVAPASRNGTDAEGIECGMSISGSHTGAVSESGDSILMSSPDRDFLTKSTRYDGILLKEDSKDTNWLHSMEDKSDQNIVFDHRFEPLPEPFALP